MPTVPGIADTLQAELEYSKPLEHYYTNISGQTFDSLFADALVREPSASQIASARLTGRAIFDLFDAVEKRDLQEAALDALAEYFESDVPPWFPECPTIGAFVDMPDKSNAKAMLTTIYNRHDD